MPRLWIDGKPVEVERGSTVLDAARKLGIDIPTLCYLEGVGRPTSCLVCLVRVNNDERLVPSCATIAEEGMQVVSETEEVHAARRTALELLLSDHAGDCLAPCHRICPLGLDIPRILRFLGEGQVEEAIRVVKEEIAFPAITGRVCHHPCERGCRRVLHDDAVAIALLERFVGDAALATASSRVILRAPLTGKRVAIVGAGAAGLSAAYFLLRHGYECTLFEEHDVAGGVLRNLSVRGALPEQVLDAEIATLENLGATWRMEIKVGEHVSLHELVTDHDAVLVATGPVNGDNHFGLEITSRGIKSDGRTHATSIPLVFAAGEVVRGKTLPVRSMADGKSAAICIHQHLSKGEIPGPIKPFSTALGRLRQGELEMFLLGASPQRRVSAPSESAASISLQQAQQESRRCLQCDCRKVKTCALRKYAAMYRVDSRRFRGERKPFEQNTEHPDVIYEPGKCIVCGRCVMLAEAAHEELGVAFMGRGFDIRVGVPFGCSLAEGLEKVATDCAEHCPTAALVVKSVRDTA